MNWRVTGAAAMLAVLAVMAMSTATPVYGQVYIGPSGVAPGRGSWEAGGGAVWAPGYDLGSREAELTRNGDAALGPFDLFSTRTSIDPAAGVQGRLAYYLTPSVAIEAGARYARPTVAVRLATDAENADDTTATEQISQYVLDGSLVFHVRNLAFAGGRAVPFVSGGGGYVRELHQGNELIETGNEIHATAGIKFWLGGGRRRFGVRAEGGASSRSGGFDFQDGRRTVPVASASLIYVF